MNYIIHGAGAVGSAIGGLLARAGHRVTLAGRTTHINAINCRGGLLMRTLDGDMVQQVHAVEHLSEARITNDTVVFQTMKAQDTNAACEELAALTCKAPVFCWQNGVDNEALASQMFPRVYGGVVRFTATMSAPGETQFAGTGKLILGRYPQGTDAITEAVAADLNDTGLTIITSPAIMQDKWLKLLVNCISCIKPMTIKTTGEPAKRMALCRAILQEAVTVLEKAGITAASTNGTEDSPETMLANFDHTLHLAEGTGQGMVLQNSTWQSLARKAKTLENDWYTGKIIALGKAHKVPTPCNNAVLSVLHDMAARGLGPESVAIEEIEKKILPVHEQPENPSGL